MPLSRRSLRVSEPSCNRLSTSVEGGPKAKPLVRQVAHSGIDRPVASAAIDGALCDSAACIDPEPHEHRRARRPAVEKLAWNIAAAQYGRREVRRLGNASVPAAAQPGTAV